MPERLLMLVVGLLLNMSIYVRIYSNCIIKFCIVCA